MRCFFKKRIYLIENKLSRKPKVQHGFVLKISHSIGINNKKQSSVYLYLCERQENVFYAFSLEVSKIMPIFAAEQ